MMKRTLTTDFVDTKRQNTDSRFGLGSEPINSTLDIIDSSEFSSSYVSRTDSNMFDGPDFFSNRTANNGASSLVVPLTPIGCNKTLLNVNNNSASSNNLFGKYLLNKKFNSVKQHQLLGKTKRLGSDDTKERAAQFSESPLLENNVDSFDNEDDREFFQSITDANTNNNNSNYYYNSNSAISRGSFLDNEVPSSEYSGSHYTYSNNDVEDLMLDDTLDQIYNNGENDSYDNKQPNYTINPMITQINPKQFVSSEYDIEDIDMLLQEAEELEQAAASTAEHFKKNHITAKSVSDYNIFIKGEDGIELPVQEVFKKFNFSLFDTTSSSTQLLNTPVKNDSSLSLSSPSYNSALSWSSKSFSLPSSATSFENIQDTTVDSTQKIEEEEEFKHNSMPSMISAILKEDKNKNASNTDEYTCEHANCRKSFSRPYDLVRHTKTIHSKQKKLYRCLICIKELGDVEGHKKTFSRGDALSRHIKLKHELKIGDESLRFAMKFAKENVEYVEN